MKLVGFDVETWGTLPEYALQASRVREGKSWVTSAAFVEECDTGQSIKHQFDFPTAADLRPLLRRFKREGFRVVCWNTTFDAGWLVAIGLEAEVLELDWLDGMLLWKHLRVQPTFAGKESPYGLKAAVAKFLPHAVGYEEDVNFGAERGTPEYDKLTKYNVEDAEYTLTLTRLFLKQLRPSQRRVALVEAACIPMVAQADVEGITLDRAALETLAPILEGTSANAFVQLKFADPVITREIIASPTQLGEHIRVVWGSLITKLTPTGRVSTDREALQLMAVDEPRAGLVNEYREALNNKTKFVDGALESLDYNGDGRVRPRMKIFSTYTGRATYTASQGKGTHMVRTGIPLHQWKRAPEFRKAITVPEGYTLVEWDFAGQEYRWMAVVSGDPVMIEMCQPGEDAHMYMGAVIAGRDSYKRMQERLKHGDPEVKKIRQFGKVANLSLGYRTSAKTLRVVAATQHKIKIDHGEAMSIYRSYQSTYKAVPMYWRRQIRKFESLGYVDNLAGRRITLSPQSDPSTSMTWAAESTAINYPIQSMGAEQKYAALMLLKYHLPRWGGRFYFELHDGIYCIFPSEVARDAALALKDVLSNIPYDKIYDLRLPVKFPVDCKMGPSWGEMVEVE